MFKKLASLTKNDGGKSPGIKRQTSSAIPEDTKERARTDLEAAEAGLKSAWTGAQSSPFLADVPMTGAERQRLAATARLPSIERLFSHYPVLGTWSVLVPLVENYGADSKEVYRHISRGIGSNVHEDLGARDHFKSLYKRAARKIGLPITGNHPTDLFFAPLGPAQNQHEHLAHAFVAMALSSGPPASEDTAAARHWQRIAVAQYAQNHTRLKASIDFDKSAYCARRFEAWRRGETPATSVEAHLFEAYDRAARARGQCRTDLVGPPKLFWTGDTLAFEAEASKRSQNLKLGPFPTPMQSRGCIALKTPWAEHVTWRCENHTENLPAAPKGAELLVFDADTGALLGRIGPQHDRFETSSHHLVLLSRLSFSTGEFGEALPSRDPSVRIAWFKLGDTIILPDRQPLKISALSEPSLALDAPVLGRDGSCPLYACDGKLLIHIDPDLGGPNRVLRARFASTVRYAGLKFDHGGMIAVPLSDLGFGNPSDPAPVLLEVLAPGAAGTLDARAELTLKAWIWPSVDSITGTQDTLPRPGNFVEARSAGLSAIDDRITVRHDADTDAPILGIASPEEGGKSIREFRLAVRGERLWHIRIEKKDRVQVRRGALVGLGHAERHDTFVLKSDDRDADLLVLGKRIRRPFHSKTQFDINASLLETDADDDRIALERKGGRIDILARLERIDDPAEIYFDRSGGGTTLSFASTSDPDALRLVIDTATGETLTGEIAFSYAPVDRPLPSGITSTWDCLTKKVILRVPDGITRSPSRARIELRAAGKHGFLPVLDTRGTALAFPIDGPLACPDRRSLLALVGFLAVPYPEAISPHVETIFAAHYADAVRAVGASGRVGSVKSALDFSRPDGQPPLHDLVGVAPWIFEASPHAFNRLSEGSGLAPLSQMASIPAPANIPHIHADTPLIQWLDMLDSDANIPEALSSGRLAHAFHALRFQLKETDLSRLVREGADATAMKLLADVHIEDIDRLRLFDHQGGGDPSAARIAALIERFARAASEKRAQDFLARIAARTGLPEATCGRLITLAIRAGAELFAYFRALWFHAAEAAPRSKTDRT